MSEDLYNTIREKSENPVDLTEFGNDSVKKFAEHLFSKNSVYQDYSLLQLDDSMDNADLFCMLVELLLYGFDIVTCNEGRIFELCDLDNPVLSKMNEYLLSTGFKIHTKMDYIENVNLYRERDDYYCELTSIPPPFLRTGGWYINNKYRILTNNRYKFTTTTKISEFKIYMINTEKNIVIFNFDICVNL